MNATDWAAVALAAAAAYVLLPRFLGGRKVSSEVVNAKLAAGALVLDVRTLEEFRSGAWPGAIHIPLQALPARMGELPRDRPIVVYCASGMRSARATEALRRAGFADVVNAGGLGSLLGSAAR
ncbi:MAG TPA: rhodanese-like domain-containing protein [Anaeromyxobacteraceae bacterium]|nr:rhodanese-like domain-containing protein [Anaeromyxobacteraceae bacterium]